MSRAEVAHDAPGPLDREPDHAARLAVLLVAEIGERGLEDQPDARDRLLRPVVQRQREASPLLLLGRQEPVGEARALALAFLGLRPQRSRERVQAPVLAGPRAEVREHPQLRELERRERRVGAPDDREICRPEALGSHGDRADLGCQPRLQGLGDVAGARQRGRYQRRVDRIVRGADEQAVLAGLDDQGRVRLQELPRRAREPVEHSLLVEIVLQPGDRGDEPVERIRLLEEIARDLALEGDGRSASARWRRARCSSVASATIVTASRSAPIASPTIDGSTTTALRR